MKNLLLLLLLGLAQVVLGQTNYVIDGGFENLPVGPYSLTTTGNGTLGTAQAGKWQQTFVTGSCPGGCAAGTAQVVNNTANSGSKSYQLTITKHTNRNEIRLFQVFPASPAVSPDKYELSFFMKADAVDYLFTVDVFKSNQAVNLNGSVPYAALFRSTTSWKQYKMVVDLSSWTDVERTNMRISIRPNTNTNSTLPVGPYPKTFWIDDVVFKPYTTRGDLAGLKDIAIQVAQERQQLAATAGFTAEANALASQITQLQASTPTLPVLTDKAIGFNPAIQVTTNNPFLHALNTWASGYLSQTAVVYQKAKPGTTLFPNSDPGASRNLGPTLEQLYWLLVSPLSEYQYNGELFRRFLRIVYATSDDYTLNGQGEPDELPQTSASALNDWFTTGPVAYGWRMADYSFATYLPDFLRQRLRDAALAVGTNYQRIETALPQGTYTNRDISYAEALMHTGLFLDKPEWVELAKTLVRSVTNQTTSTGMFPDGAYSYIRTQNEVANYHGATNNSLAKLWAVSDYQPAWDALGKGANYELLSIEAQDVPEFYTAPAWKTQWNALSGASGEPLLAVSENPYLKTKFDQLKAIYGYSPSPLFASFYKPNLTSKPLPDNYVVYDRNIQGPRGRYGRFSYGMTGRNVAPTGYPETGLQTFVGAMTTQPGRATNRDEMNASLMAVHSKVHVRKNTGTQWQDWAYMAAKGSPKVSVARTAATFSSPAQLQYQTGGPTGNDTPWSTYQQWITLPDRMIGLVETYPTDQQAAQALEIDGRVRFTYGRTGPITPKNLVVEEAGKRYAYGTLKAIIHEHDFQTVTTGLAGVLRDDTQQAEEIIFRYNESDGTNLYTYPGSTKKYFIIEIRNADAVGDAVVNRVQNGDLKGLIVKLNGKAFSSFRNNGATDATVDISAGLVAGNTNEVHFSRADAPGQLAQVLSTTALSLPAGEQVLTVSSNDEADLGNGWQNFDQTLTGIPTNTAPIAQGTLASQTATVGQSFSLTTPVFTDLETPARLTITATGLPDGLSFADGLISGTPNGPGTSTITLKATDPNGLSAEIAFTLIVNLPNTAPVASAPIASQTATVGQAFSLTVPGFTDAETPDQLTVTATGLPDGLTFANGLISGTPTTAGSTTITLTATDPQGLSVSNAFELKINRANTAPVASAPIASQTATVGQAFSLVIPAFTDAETPDQLTITAAGLPNGLVFANGLISGTPTTAGSTTITLTATDPQGLSANTTFGLTVSQATTLKIQHRDGDNGQTNNNQISPYLRLVNVGSSAIPYGEITVRYWFTAENFAPINTWIDYAQIGNSNVKMKYVGLDQPRTGATGYVEYSFLPAAGNLAAGGNSGEIQTRISKQNWTNFAETDDYSYAANTGYTFTDKVTVYRTLPGGTPQLVWGIEPAPVAPSLALKAQSENKNGNPATNTISTYLKVSNTGNTPIAYSELLVRYWFTAEGNQPLNYWIDYAELGAGKVKGKFVKLPTPLPTADTYLELTFDPSLGNLNPWSHTGNIQYRIAKSDWSAFNETNDHSYLAAAPMADNGRITIYQKNASGQLQLLYGTEPQSSARLSVAESPEVQLALYPNPAETHLIIRSGSSVEPIDVTFYGISGRAVHQEKTQYSSPIDIRHLPTGVYLLKVQADQAIHYLRLLKK